MSNQIEKTATRADKIAASLSKSLSRSRSKSSDSGESDKDKFNSRKDRKQEVPVVEVPEAKAVEEKVGDGSTKGSESNVASSGRLERAPGGSDKRSKERSKERGKKRCKETSKERVRGKEE